MLKLLISFDYSWVEFEREIMFSYFTDDPTSGDRGSSAISASQIAEIEGGIANAGPTLNIFAFRNSLHSSVSLFRFTEFLSKKPNSEDMTFFIIMLSETWIFLEKHQMYKPAQLAEMDSEMIISLPRVSILFHLYTKVNECIETILKKRRLKKIRKPMHRLRCARPNEYISDPQNSEKPSKQLFNLSLDMGKPEGDPDSVYNSDKEKSANIFSKTLPQALIPSPKAPEILNSNSPHKQADFRVSDLQYILTVLLEVKNKIYAKPLQLESTWWFRNKKENIEIIKEKFINSVIQYFILSAQNLMGLSAKSDILDSFKACLLEYYLLVCNIVIHSTVDEELIRFEDLKKYSTLGIRTAVNQGSSQEGFIVNPLSQINNEAERKGSRSSNETVYLSVESGSVDNACDFENEAIKTTQKELPGFNIPRESISTLIELDHRQKNRLDTNVYTETINKTSTSRSHQKNGTSMESLYLNQKYDAFESSIKNNTESIGRNVQELYLEVCKVADALQTGTYAKPLRTVFQVVHKMNADSNLEDQDDKNKK